MKISPQNLKQEFKDLFDLHFSIENSTEFQNKKRKFNQLKLETKHDLNTLNEIFQDSDLLAKVSEEAHQIMRIKAKRPTRARSEQDLITFKKPQAKDVLNRKIEDDMQDIYNTLEQIVNQETEFINPLAPKQRKYLSSEDAQQEERSELEALFDETSKLIKSSPLQTVGSKHLYACLPRQSDPNALIYVKQDYIPTVDENDWPSATNDTLLTIQIFNPQNPHIKFLEIEILGSQFISQIRDLIYCQSDFMENHDKHTNEEVLNTPEKKLSPSFIYMDHVFYLDTRHADFNQDYYEPIIHNWLTKKKVNQAVFQYEKQTMQDCRLEAVEFELHRPLAFVHQEHCEHMVMVKDIRLISPNEYKSKDDFPRTTHNLRYVRAKCSMCSIYPATKVTHEDIISGFSPCYFCDVCFDSFHSNDPAIQVKEYYGTPGGETKRKK